ncbi:hypothetical protein [Alkalicoccus urumqiensis]|uniref:Uncharacterized protein n=1 Tax=Alkalicoccus urumqiensis TaxID=1548213 RepID=A0A2P6MDF4_ALKUR|nr:hypothetical protein [Alkalicoccus urumqiensis]PRO64321.1 hypothetical protein C6I21_15410 [Alkalicoccus urumqiensis]
MHGYEVLSSCSTRSGSFTPAEESEDQLSSEGLPGLVARDQGASAFQIPSGTFTAAGAGRKRELIQQTSLF